MVWVCGLNTRKGGGVVQPARTAVSDFKALGCDEQHRTMGLNAVQFVQFSGGYPPRQLGAHTVLYIPDGNLANPPSEDPRSTGPQPQKTQEEAMLRPCAPVGQSAQGSGTGLRHGLSYAAHTPSFCAFCAFLRPWAVAPG